MRNAASSSKREGRAFSGSISPMPGRSQTSILPFLTVGSGSPSEMSYRWQLTR
jgi:hypothetical protein